MTIADFRTTAASYFNSAHAYALDSRVGEGVKNVEQKLKNYNAGNILLGGSTAYIGIKTACSLGAKACRHFEKGNISKASG